MLNVCLRVDMTLYMAVGVGEAVGMMLVIYFDVEVGVSCWSEH